jgi:OFA family oxalate/formate antiporter-like MFS transporter
VSSTGSTRQAATTGVLYYGWYIVAVGFIANVASSFSLASTLSIFLKPLTADLGVSRGVFSLMRSGEGLVAASMAPAVGSLVDRHGGRWLVATGAVVATIGYLSLSRIAAFWQFLIVRWSLVTVGNAIMGSMVLNVVISRWFIKKRGRAIAFSSMGIGFGKVGMPLFAASLLVSLGWRHTWAIFGILTFILLVTPAILYIRRSPEDMGLLPDGALSETPTQETRHRTAPRAHSADETMWTRKEAVRTRAFWLIVLVFGTASIGVSGLNLHVFPYVSDLGYSDMVAATVMSVIAFTQLSSPLVWGFVAERLDVRRAAMTQFLIQGSGLILAIASGHLSLLYVGFFIYGIGLGGNMVLPDVMWAKFFGRVSLGRIRGLGYFLSHVLSATGPPFFGFLFDYLGSYELSFTLFAITLVGVAFLSLFIIAPEKRNDPLPRG